MKVLLKLAATRPDDWVAVPQAYYFLLLAGWKLSVRGESVKRWVKNGGFSAPDVADTLALDEERTIRRAAKWTNAAARRPWPWARCLQRSLALCLWLQSRGLDPVIGIGVRREGAGIEAHAWVEYKGRILNDSEVITGRFPKLVAAAQEPVSTR